MRGQDLDPQREWGSIPWTPEGLGLFKSALLSFPYPQPRLGQQRNSSLELGFYRICVLWSISLYIFLLAQWLHSLLDHHLGTFSSMSDRDILNSWATQNPLCGHWFQLPPQVTRVELFSFVFFPYTLILWPRCQQVACWPTDQGRGGDGKQVNSPGGELDVWIRR